VTKDLATAVHIHSIFIANGQVGNNTIDSTPFCHYLLYYLVMEEMIKVTAVKTATINQQWQKQ